MGDHDEEFIVGLILGCHMVESLVLSFFFPFCVVGGGGLAGQPEREEKVSLELTEEILKSMEVGMAFRDYVGFSFLNTHKQNLIAPYALKNS